MTWYREIDETNLGLYTFDRSYVNSVKVFILISINSFRARYSAAHRIETQIKILLSIVIKI